MRRQVRHQGVLIWERPSNGPRDPAHRNAPAPRASTSSIVILRETVPDGCPSPRAQPAAAVEERGELVLRHVAPADPSASDTSAAADPPAHGS